jgi:hypothetical protein
MKSVTSDLSSVVFIDEIGMGALQDLIYSIHRQNGIDWSSYKP